ncbi:hypothetical protein JCM10207_003501 [Rhodosporidiobolus poonsookiae]
MAIGTYVHRKVAAEPPTQQTPWMTVRFVIIRHENPLYYRRSTYASPLPSPTRGITVEEVFAAAGDEMREERRRRRRRRRRRQRERRRGVPSESESEEADEKAQEARMGGEAYRPSSRGAARDAWSGSEGETDEDDTAWAGSEKRGSSSRTEKRVDPYEWV